MLLNNVNFFRVALLIGLALPLISACDGNSSTGAAAPLESPEKATAPAGTISTSAPTQGNSDMTALQNILAQYISANPLAWNAFDNIHGVSWQDHSPVENPDTQPIYSHSRSGRITLSGFAETDLPNGKAGPDADYEPGNEGESGITLNGTAEAVTSIAVMKFYPDRDYRAVLGKQFDQRTRIELIANRCRLAEGTNSDEPNMARNEFFKITLPSGAMVFAEGSVDEEGGKYSPGSTTYFFYRSKPDDRIESMQCSNIE